MQAKTTFLVTSTALVAAAFAVMVLHGGWEAVAAGLMILAAFACLACVLALVARADRQAWR